MNVETRRASVLILSKLLLQLSHIHMNVETSPRPALYRKLKRLQLSHIHMNVETLRTWRREERRPLSFN